MAEAKAKKEPAVPVAAKKEEDAPFWTYDGRHKLFKQGMREEDYGATIPAGVYRGGYDNGRYYLLKHPMTHDAMIRVPGALPDAVLANIADFYASEAKYRKHGLVFKRGILLEGPAGSGKTAITNMVVKDFAARGGIAIVSTHPSTAGAAIGVLREVEPERRVLVILEDVDNVVENGDEDELLSLLDGQNQFDGVVFLATTNHLEKLPARLRNRPSRFDEVIHVGMPDYAMRLAYLRTKIVAAEHPQGQIEKWADATDGLSIAHLKEFVIAVACLGRDGAATIARLKEMGADEPG